MKNKILISAISSVLSIAVTFSSCKTGKNDNKEQEYEVYENHEISACGINDPLLKIEWLRDYCKIFYATQNFSSVSIDLYRIIDTGEHFFKIGIAYSDFEYSPFLYSEDWRNCAGEFIFVINSGVPPNTGLVEEFIKDKVFVAELLHFKTI